MPWRVWTVWLLFLVRGSFYCAMLPLWEGWDEYAHFAWLEHWITRGTLPKFHDPISREIDESMRLAPLAYELRWIGAPYLTHSEWWALNPGERAARVRALAAIPAEFARQPAMHPFDFYEAQQPPLYYWAVSVPLRLAGTWPVESRVLLIRLFSMAIASLAIPLAWMAGRRALDDGLALMCAALLAVAPGFAIDVCRVANDSLAIALTALLLCLLMREKPTGMWVGIAAGCILGTGLLTKAYLVPLAGALAILWWGRKRQLAVASGVAACIAGWWYARNLMMGDSVSGWYLHASPGEMLKAAFRINWFSSAHVIAKSAMWFGGWSFLTLRAWMYMAVEITVLIGAGLAVKRSGKDLTAPAIMIACYLPAMAYGVLIYAVSQNVPNIPGWYLWPLGGALAVIQVAGLRGYSRALIAGLAAVDLYGVMALLVPYYAGLAERNRAAGGQFLAGLARLEVPFWLAFAWIAATLGIVALAMMTDYGREKRIEHQR